MRRYHEETSSVWVDKAVQREAYTVTLQSGESGM